MLPLMFPESPLLIVDDVFNGLSDKAGSSCHQNHVILRRKGKKEEEEKGRKLKEEKGRKRKEEKEE